LPSVGILQTEPLLVKVAELQYCLGEGAATFVVGYYRGIRFTFNADDFKVFGKAENFGEVFFKEQCSLV